MKKIILLFLFFTTNLFASPVILVVGDSLSAGYGIEVAQSWPKLLEQKLQQESLLAKVVNISISGNTSSNGLAQLPAALATYHPTITIIALGGNDGLRGLKIDVLSSNLQKMITLAKENGSAVILCGVRLPPNYGQEYISAFEGAYQALHAKNDILLLPNLLSNIDENRSLMQNDQVHPTANAQALILDNVWPSLKGLLKP